MQYIIGKEKKIKSYDLHQSIYDFSILVLMLRPFLTLLYKSILKDLYVWLQDKCCKKKKQEILTQYEFIKRYSGNDLDLKWLYIMITLQWSKICI